LGDYELGIASPQVVYALLEGFVALQVLGAWVVDLAEVGFGFTGYYGVNRHEYREDWGCSVTPGFLTVQLACHSSSKM